MKIVKKFFVLIIFFFSFINNSWSQTASEFISDLTFKASDILSSKLTVEEKIIQLERIGEESVDIDGVGLYTLGKYRKTLTDTQKKQYKELLKTENVELVFTDDGIDTLAKISAEVNSSVENIGARRLHTIVEKVLDDISFNATDKAGETITIDKNYVNKNLGNLVKDTDLSKFIL